MNYLARPVPYHLCASGWTLVLWELLKRTHDKNLLNVHWPSLIGYLAAMFVVGIMIGLGAFLLNEVCFRALMHLRGRNVD